MSMAREMGPIGQKRSSQLLVMYVLPLDLTSLHTECSATSA